MSGWSQRKNSAKKSASQAVLRRRRLAVEPLEERCVLTSNLYLDFGDNLPVGGLLITNLQMRDTFANGGIQGPDLRGFGTPGIADTTTLRLTSMQTLVNFDYNQSGIVDAVDYSDLRSAIVALVTRYYEPFDVNVQIAPVLNNASSTTYIAGISTTLQLGLAVAGERDQWVFIQNVTRTDTGADVGATSGLYGIATGNDIAVNNNRDDCAYVFASTLLADFPNANADTAVGRTAAHEAGHNFGLEHTASFTANDLLLNQSDIILEGGSTSTAQRNSLNFFTRYPLNTQFGNPVTVNSATRLLNPNLLGPRAGAPDYITGTGAHDIITITNAGGGLANVTVQAFSNTTRTTAIVVPGTATTTFSYQAILANGLLIEGGQGNDQIIIDSTINVPIIIRGMGGTDELVINNVTGSGSFTPGGSTQIGFDGITSFGASLSLNTGGMSITLSEYEVGSTVTVNGSTAFIYRTPNSADNLTVDATGGRNRISGTTGGVSVVPFIFVNMTDFAIDSATADAVAGNDIITVSAGLVSTGLRNFTILTGAGDDTVNFTTITSFLLPTAGGGISVDGGIGTDIFGVTHNALAMTLNAASLVSSLGGSIAIAAMETVNLTGGAADNLFVTNGFAGNVNVSGGAGSDRLLVMGNNAATGIYTPGAAPVNGMVGSMTIGAMNLTFNQFEVASTIFIQDVQSMTFQTPNPIDLVVYDSPGTLGRLAGLSSGVSFVLMIFTNVTNMIIDTGTFDIGAGADNVSITAALTAAGLQTLTINTGEETDVLTLTGTSYLTPGGGAFTFNGGNGTDIVSVINNLAVNNLANSSVSIPGFGAVTLNSVENALFTGGAAGNIYNINSWNGAVVAVDGQGGNDTVNVSTGNIDAVSGTIYVTGGVGADTCVINDSASLALATYNVNSLMFSSTSLGGAARPLVGVVFEATLETLTVQGAADANQFNVTPSVSTTINIFGNNPTAVGPGVDELVVDLFGTGGRTFVNVAGNGSWTFPGSGSPLTGVRAPINFNSIELFNNFSSYAAAGAEAGANSLPLVKVVDLISGEVIEFLAYESTYRQGVRVFTGDVTGDSTPEIIVAPRKGRAPELRVFTMQGVELTAYRTLAYAANFTNGVNVAIGDVDGDGRNDLITVPDRGVAEVRVFRNQTGINVDPMANVAMYRFNAFSTNFIGGAFISSGDFNFDGRDEIVVSSGSGQAATVVVFNPAELPLIAANAATPSNPPIAFARYTNFFDPSFRGGASVSVGRINGDLTPDIVVGQGAGGQSLVAMLDGTTGRRQPNGTFAPTVRLGTFQAYSDSANSAAVFVAARDFDRNGIVDWIFTGQAPDGRTRTLRQFRPTLPTAVEFPLFGAQKFAGFNIG